MVNVAFVTCVQLGLSCIEAIHEIGGHFQLLITLNDKLGKKKSGRAYLDEIAQKQGAELLKIENINEPVVLETLNKHKIDWLFIIGWSQIAKADLLNTPKYGCIGMHPTLLPAGRGRASIPWAIIKGLSQTGVTMFRLDEGVDTGDIIGQGIIDLNERSTATELYEEVNHMHIQLIKKYWLDIIQNKISFRKQDEAKATNWPGRKPEDGEIRGDMTTEEAERLVRAVTHPYPGAFYDMGNKIIRVWSAKINSNEGDIKLKDGFLIPIEYEYEGKE